jgi:hypothetical protein
MVRQRCFGSAMCWLTLSLISFSPKLAKAPLVRASRLLVEAQRAVARGRRRSRRRVTLLVAERDEVMALSGRVAEQIRQRFAGEKIVNRLVSLFDLDARSIRKGKSMTRIGSSARPSTRN